MRIDVVTIFPDYLAPLSLSLVGKAIENGIVDLGVHDLRGWTHDRHRTVDDTPYGGGAGMVMKPEPWGAALDEISSRSGLPTAATTLIVPTPSGRPFDQRLAGELADAEHLVFACGRYEGIDARVVTEASSRMRVEEVSIGDYVLNGGEVAALVIIEAVVRLLPGVIGNPESLTEESYAEGHDGLLEYPVFTKPPSWRGHDVPEVLFSGHHARIAAWRREQAVELTRRRRPELLPEHLVETVVRRARPGDAGEMLTLQRAAFVVEAQAVGTAQIPPLTQPLDELATSIDEDTFLVAQRGPRLVGAVLGRVHPDGAWYVGRLAVLPDHQGHGLGGRLLAAIEQQAPAGTTTVRLQTGAASAANLAFYRRRGYEVVAELDLGGVAAIQLEKTVQAAPSPAPSADLDPRSDAPPHQ